MSGREQLQAHVAVLEAEVRKLRDQLADEEKDHEQCMEGVANALGLKVWAVNEQVTEAATRLCAERDELRGRLTCAEIIAEQTSKIEEDRQRWKEGSRRNAMGEFTAAEVVGKLQALGLDDEAAAITRERLGWMAELTKLRAERDKLLAALYTIGWEPIGEPEDDTAAVLHHVEQFARAVYAKYKEAFGGPAGAPEEGPQ